ncbi:extracellular solute-binding protein [Thermodesulfobacteriota bacterium]
MIEHLFRYPILMILAIILIFGGIPSAFPGDKEVVVYTALDQIYSEPVLKRFEEKTGIKVKAVYDVEATKTIGLVNRIIAEKSYPQCDVFWNNEPVNTIRLKNKGLLTPYVSPEGRAFPNAHRDPEHHWYGFAARARVIVYNTVLMKEKDKPLSINDLLDQRWKNRATMAVPLFGTTATHATALFHVWGHQRALEFFKNLKKNGVDLVDGNSVVRDKVADGSYLWGLTDTDDVYSGMQRGLSIDMLLPDQDGIGTLLIPNTVALIRNAPHPGHAKMLIDFLLSEGTEKMLAISGSGQIPLRTGLKPVADIPSLGEIRQMDVDYQALALLMEEVLPILEKEFF